VLAMAKAVEQMNARVSVGTGERISRRAQVEKISKNELINRAIERYLSAPTPKRDEFDD